MRRTLPLRHVATVAVALTACAFAVGGSPGPASTSTTTATKTTSMTSAASVVPGCRTRQLAVWVGVPGSGTAGSTYYELQLSNVSTTTCSLHGYPGVSAVTGTGRQLGSAAARDARFTPATVVLAPGTTAHAVLRVTDVSVFPPSRCRATTSAGLRVYPPNETASVTVPFPLHVCTTAVAPYLSVRTVRVGTGIPGHSQ